MIFRETVDLELINYGVRVVDFPDSIELDNMEELLVKLNRGVIDKIR